MRARVRPVSSTSAAVLTEVLAVMLAPVLALSGCADEPAPQADPAVSAIEVVSSAFEDGGRIPVRFTCDGGEASPPLSWSGVPKDAASLALVVDDPDAPGGTFVHWVVLDIPVDTRSVAEGRVPEAGVQTQNSSGGSSYAGPCPPSGTHHYRFTVYAMSDPTGLEGGAASDDALDAVGEAALARGTLVGTYTR